MLLREENQALRVAVEMEQRAITLYERALQLAQDASMIRAAEELLRDERSHLIRFRSFLSGEEQPAGGEDALAAGALAAEVLFPGGLMAMSRADALKSAEALYRFAAENEADAVARYTEFAQKSEGAVREAFLTIAAEEKNHLQGLQETLRRLEK